MRLYVNGQCHIMVISFDSLTERNSPMSKFVSSLRGALKAYSLPRQAAAILAIVILSMLPSTAQASSATYLTTDTSTQGNWKGIYGGDGYNVAGDASSNNPSDPSYAATNISGASTKLISANSTDVRALKAALPASTTRVAAYLYSSTALTLDVNVTDQNPHNIALYMADWTGNSLTQTVTIKDAATGATLNTKPVSAFTNGEYLVWQIQGHVSISIAKSGTSTIAVLGGIFYDYPGPIVSSIAVSPASASVAKGTNRQFTAVALDQYGNPLSTQPAITWAVSGGGSISATGLFGAGNTLGGPFTVTATASGVTGKAKVNVAATHIVTFGTVMPISIPGTLGATAADIDDDGHLDIIVQIANGHIFLYGNGDGTFTQVNYPYSLATGFIATGDVNKDGKTDLICSSYNTIAVIKNLGSRTFAAPVIYDAAGASNTVALGDFNEDGYLDAATVGSTSNDLAVLLNNGDGTFGVATHHEIPTVYNGYAVGLVALDFDSDGHIDLAAAEENEFSTAMTSVFVGDGQGNFTLAPNSTQPIGGGVLLGVDLNNDGITDLANSDHWFGQPRWALLNGKGGYSLVSTQEGGGYAGRMTAADFDGDGFKDLDEAYDSFNALFINNGDGTFPKNVHYGLSANSPVSGDFDEDGQPDLIVWNNNGLYLYPNTTNPAPTITNLLPDGAAVGGSATLVVQGHGLLKQSVIYWNTTALATTFNYHTGLLTANITAAQLATAGTASVTVKTPTPGGGTSNALPFYIGKVPTSIKITPSPVTVNVGATAQLTATVLDQTGAAMPVQPLITWKTVGKANTITPDGLFSSGNNTGVFNVTASYGGITATTPVTIANFSLSATPQSLTLTQGLSAFSTVTITPSAGFSSNVMLTASQLPAGVVATFQPGATSTTSKVTFTASSTATLGAANVVITGVVDGNTQTTVIALNIVAKVIPPVPANVKAVAGDKSITVSWSASAGASTYNVYQSSGGSAYALAKSTNTTSVTISNLTNDIAYSFEVTAVGTGGPSAKSAPVTATPAGVSITAGPTVTRSGTTATIKWTTNIASKSQVDYGTTTTLGTTVTNAALVTSHSVTLTGLSATGTYYYKITSTDDITTATSAVKTLVPMLPPTITSFTPTTGPIGAVVTITGTNLTNVTYVKFNGTVSNAAVMISATTLKASVPSGATTGTISVITSGGSATSTAKFTVIPSPAITSFTPASGPVGTKVTITGTNLTGTTGVKVNGTAATSVTVVSPTTVTFIVAAGTTTGKVALTTPGGTATSTASFTVIVLPTLKAFAFNPTTVKAGASSVATVTLSSAALTGGAVVTITQGGFTSFQVTVPAGKTSATLTITANPTASGPYVFNASYAGKTLAATLTVN